MIREDGVRVSPSVPPTGHRSYAAVHILDNPYAIDEAYHYYIPPTMADAVVRGAFVTVPFGRGNRKQLGVVVSLCEADGLPRDLFPDRIKPLGGVCRERLFLNERQLAICFYLVETTLCTMGDAVRTVVPPSALATLVEYYHATEAAVSPEEETMLARKASELLILSYIRGRGSVSGQSIKTRFGGKATASLEYLCDHGFVERELTVRQPTIPTVTYYTLACPADTARAILEGQAGVPRVTSDLQRAILHRLLKVGDRETAVAIKAATGAGNSQLKSLVSKGLIAETVEEASPSADLTDGTLSAGVRTPHDLSDEQAEAVRTLEALAATGEPRAALLHGVTGSGKTCVILEMIDRMLDRGKGVIVLLPEISLTPQMLDIFHARYGYRVAVIHSGLSAGERLASHRRILSGDAPVVVGTRSAIFAPVPDLGMIVMDEEQEHTYKSDMNPKYHARDIARYRCATENALMLLSSATPSLESYQKALDGKYTLITMKARYGAAALPAVRVVDMRGEPRGGNLSPVGEVLLRELDRVRREGNQSVLFLNRRGYSPQMICRSCGQAVTCSRCSVAMNVHKASGHPEGVLVCHWCGERRTIPTTCPSCESLHLARMGYGTQRVEEDLDSLFPDARILRMDADTTSAKTAYTDMLGEFRRHEADILLGTQMVTKGHDFPDVTLVGVLMADMSLYLDDYRAGERTFSMLTQVIGRAGRGEKPGLAIIQTMNPDHDILKSACAQDYETFFHREIRLRRLLQFPPFCDIVLLTLTSPNEKELQKACLRLDEEVRRLTMAGVGEFSDVPIVAFGPFEAPVYRVDNVYRMRMVIKCRLNRRSRALFSQLMVTFSAVSRGAHKPVLSVDFNPSSI